MTATWVDAQHTSRLEDFATTADSFSSSCSSHCCTDGDKTGGWWQPAYADACDAARPYRDAWECDSPHSQFATEPEPNPGGPEPDSKWTTDAFQWDSAEWNPMDGDDHLDCASGFAQCWAESPDPAFETRGYDRSAPSKLSQEPVASGIEVRCTADFAVKYECPIGYTTAQCYRLRAKELHPDKQGGSNTSFLELRSDFDRANSTD